MVFLNSWTTDCATNIPKMRTDMKTGASANTEQISDAGNMHDQGAEFNGEQIYR